MPANITVPDTFPDIGVLPSQEGWEEEAIDDTISVEQEGGYAFTRPRNTRGRWRYTVKHEYVAQTAWDTLKSWVDTRVYRSAVPFNFVHPVTGDNMVVRFVKGQCPTAKYQGFGGDLGNAQQGLFEVSYQIEEV